MTKHHKKVEKDDNEVYQMARKEIRAKEKGDKKQIETELLTSAEA